VVRDRIELSTFRFSGAIRPSWTVAGRRLISRLPALIVAGRRPASVTACLGSPFGSLQSAFRPSLGYIHLALQIGREESDPRGAAVYCARMDHRSLQRSLVPQSVILPGSRRGAADDKPQEALRVRRAQVATDRRWGQPRIVVESVWGAVPDCSRSFCPGPLAEPAVPASRQRALHGLCRQAWFGIVQGLGTWLPR